MYDVKKRFLHHDDVKYGGRKSEDDVKNEGDDVKSAKVGRCDSRCHLYT